MSLATLTKPAYRSVRKPFPARFQRVENPNDEPVLVIVQGFEGDSAKVQFADGRIKLTHIANLYWS